MLTDILISIFTALIVDPARGAMDRAIAAALDAREAILTDAAQQDVTIRPLNGEERPWLLFYTDVAPGPDMWGLTPYFDKQSVTIAEQD